MSESDTSASVDGIMSHVSTTSKEDLEERIREYEEYEDACESSIAYHKDNIKKFPYAKVGFSKLIAKEEENRRESFAGRRQVMWMLDRLKMKEEAEKKRREESEEQHLKIKKRHAEIEAAKQRVQDNEEEAKKKQEAAKIKSEEEEKTKREAGERRRKKEIEKMKREVEVTLFLADELTTEEPRR